MMIWGVTCLRVASGNWEMTKQRLTQFGVEDSCSLVGVILELQITYISSVVKVLCALIVLMNGCNLKYKFRSLKISSK